MRRSGFLVVTALGLVGLGAGVMAMQARPPAAIWTDGSRIAASPAGDPIDGYNVSETAILSDGPESAPRMHASIGLTSDSIIDRVRAALGLPRGQQESALYCTANSHSDVRDAAGVLWWRCDLRE